MFSLGGLMLKQACKYYVLQCLLYILSWIIHYSRKLLKGILNHSEETFSQAVLSSLIDILLQLKHSPTLRLE